MHQHIIALCLNIKYKTILQGYDDLCQCGQYSPCSCESVIRVTVGTGGGGGGGGSVGSQHCNI